jgi:tetratricopeptide (TPR) repeat protein
MQGRAPRIGAHALLVWLFRAFLFFTLFAFALNNQQSGHRALVLRRASGTRRWSSWCWWPSRGCAIGVLAMVPSWWRTAAWRAARHRHRRRRSRTTAHRAARPTSAPSTRRAKGLAIDPHGLRPAVAADRPARGLCAGLAGVALRPAQWRRDSRDAPKAYFKGLNLLLNEQQDKAIDAFIEAVQNDPDTTELHFALGNLFRRRGEFERAVRVHQHLLQRADLSPGDRDRAQHALAQDFMKAGLFDRAENAFRAGWARRSRPRPGWRCCPCTSARATGLLRALATLDGTRPGTSPWLMDLLRDQPSLSAALELLDTPRADWPDSARQSVRDAVARAARAGQRYRCAACGFEAQRHFWQCPGCLGWDTFPPRHIEED